MVRHKKSIVVFAIVCLLIAALTTAVAAEERLVSLNVNDGEVKDVLSALAMLGGKNIIADDTVKDKITIQMNNVPFSQALDLVVKAKGLSYQVVNDTIMVTSLEKMGKAAVLPTRVITLKNALSDEAKKSLALIIPDDRLKSDPASNSLVFNGSDEDYNKVLTALKTLDKPLPQVLLEAQVLEVSKQAEEDSGLKWSWGGYSGYSNTANGTGDTVTSTIPSNGALNDPIKIKVFKHTYISANVVISNLLARTDVKKLAKPRVVAMDGKSAEILIGQNLPYPMKDKDGNITVNYTDAGIKLNITPKINEDDFINAKIRVEVSDATLQDLGQIKAYLKDTTSADTSVWVKDGGMIVIGGLKRATSTRNKTESPSLLAKIPLLGNLFRSNSDVDNDRDIVIIITPKIIKQ